MGIQDLFKVIKDRCSDDCIKDFHFSQLRGWSIAIDISIFLNKYVKSAGDRLWMNTFFLFLCALKKHAIRAIAIFDGPNPPIEKLQEQESRREQAKKQLARLAEAKRLKKVLMNDYIPTDIPLPDDLQEEAQKVLGYYAKTTVDLVDDILEESIELVSRKKNQRPIDWTEATDVYDLLKEQIERLENQTAPITNDIREKAWDIVKMMGIPTFQADGEAEALCAYLCIHGYVDAVLSEDTDVLAYGTPWMLAFKAEYKLSDEKVKAVYLPDVLDALGYTMEEFRDLCILLSCDYNKRVKGFARNKNGNLPKKEGAIGWKGALSMIDEHRTLEACEEYIVNIEELKYERCRELFTPISEEELLKIIQTKPYTSKPQFKEIGEFIMKEKLTMTVDYIQKCWKPVEIIIVSESESSDEDADDVDNEAEKFTSTIANNKLDEGCYVKLSAECENNKGHQKTIGFYVMFRDEEQFNEANDSGFDFLLEVFNEWINECNEGGYHIDDSVEPEKILDKKPENVLILDLSNV
jgi:5'-3' exonuclease